jgi:hypothetical protein
VDTGGSSSTYTTEVPAAIEDGGLQRGGNFTKTAAAALGLISLLLLVLMRSRKISLAISNPLVSEATAIASAPAAAAATDGDDVRGVTLSSALFLRALLLLSPSTSAANAEAFGRQSTSKEALN